MRATVTVGASRSARTAMSCTSRTTSELNMSGVQYGSSVERADSSVSTGTSIDSPAATRVCPASTAVSQAGYTVNPRTGRQVRS